MNVKQIAKLSGVSAPTVSRVLNNHPDVREATRQRVLAVMQQTNYQPNAAARSLAAGQTRVVGLMVRKETDTIFNEADFSRLLLGISSACNPHDRSVMLWLVEPEYEQRMLQKITAGGLVDGVIVSTMRFTDPLIDALQASQIPFIQIGRHAGGVQASYVDIENLNGAREAVMHLLRLGRRRIATITGPLNLISSRDRRDGYLAALTERKTPIQAALIIEGDYSENGGYRAMQLLLPHQPDAVFVANDRMAMGALRFLIETGRRVPEDVALIGFDDLSFAAQTMPSLTTVRQPMMQAGALAAEMLMELIENPASPPKRIVLPTELVIRHSCGFRTR
ncbi:MAG: LacI family DNA-binding transcriptional regulator [Chloroflexi bacterium]|nr:LacI family DNA-binding transcriptional regulator [Chloroflexota bacterium]